MSNLFHFLIDLAINPRQQEAFAESPDAVIDAVGLSESDRAVLKSGNRTQVALALADEFFQAAEAFTDPNPDPFPDPDPFPNPDPFPDPDPSPAPVPPEETKLAMPTSTPKNSYIVQVISGNINN